MLKAILNFFKPYKTTEPQPEAPVPVVEPVKAPEPVVEPVKVQAAPKPAKPKKPTAQKPVGKPKAGTPKKKK